MIVQVTQEQQSGYTLKYNGGYWDGDRSFYGAVPECVLSSISEIKRHQNSFPQASIVYVQQSTITTIAYHEVEAEGALL